MRRKSIVEKLQKTSEKKIIDILQYGTEQQKKHLCTSHYLSLSVLDKYGHNLSSECWEKAIAFQELTEEIIIKNKFRVKWNILLSFHCDFDEQFVQRFIGNFTPFNLFKNTKFSEDFLIRNMDKYWHLHSVSVYQDLSEEFMIKFSDKIRWDLVSEHQKMSLRFIIKHSHLLSEDRLRLNKKVNQKELDNHNVWVMFRLLDVN